MKELPKIINETLIRLGMNQTWADMLDSIAGFLLVILFACLANVICRHVFLRLITKLIRNTKITWDDIIFDHKVMVHLTRAVIPVVIYICIPAVCSAEETWPKLVQRICLISIIASFIFFVNELMKAFYYVYTEKEQYRDRPLKGLLQTLQVTLFIIGSFWIIGVLTEKELTTMFAALGTSAAILLLIFKDSIMGFLSGIQLSAHNMLRVGDWITMPKYSIDGSVIEVTLNTVKVRNFDNTIATIPPYTLISDSFQNWRGMSESGGRRIKRSINIDMNSVMFCTPAMLDKYRKIQLLKGYVEATELTVQEYNEKNNIDNSVLVNGRRQTNLGVFRAYLTGYIKNLPDANKEMTCMVRHLQPTETGIPLEIYFFSLKKESVPYESIQADVFDHVLAIIPEFDLRVYQNLSGADIRAFMVNKAPENR